MSATNPVGKIVTDLRTALAADGGPAAAVRGGRRFEGDNTQPGDAPPLVIVRGNSRTKARTHARWRIVTQSYALDPRLAMELDDRVSAALAFLGPRHSVGGVAIYQSTEDVGGTPSEDPDTGWSVAISTYIVNATAGTL